MSISASLGHIQTPLRRLTMIRTMKFSLLLMMTLATVDAFASNPMTCQIDLNTGEVTLESEIQIGETNQKIWEYIGKETWQEPLKYRNLCENLKTHLEPTATEEWFDHTCEGSMRVQLKLFVFNVSAEAQNLFPGRQKLRFFPRHPIHPDLQRTYFDNTCDPF